MNPWKIVGWFVVAGIVLATLVIALVTWAGIHAFRDAGGFAPAHPLPAAAPAGYTGPMNTSATAPAPEFQNDGCVSPC